MVALYIPSGTGHADFVKKKSRFIGESRYVQSIEEVRFHVKRLRRVHPYARHIVWAFVVGNDRNQQGLSDDGEPHGTAGRPIMDHIVGERLTYTLVTVVRYFGGIKLGTGGLVSAYARCARESILSMPIELLVIRLPVTMIFDYSLRKQVVYIIKKYEGIIKEEVFNMQISLTCSISEKKKHEFLQKIQEACQGNIDISFMH